MAFTAYATVPEIKAWVQLTDAIDDAVIQDVVDSTTRWIDEACQRHFWQDTASARTFSVCNRWRLDVDDLVSVTSLKTDESGDGTYEITWDASDYQLQPVNRPTGRPYTRVEAVAGRTFPIRYTTGSRSNRVEITGNWGWPAVPETVHQACLIQSSRILKRRYSPEGVAGTSDFGVIRVTRLDPDVVQLLDPYRRHVVLVA